MTPEDQARVKRLKAGTKPREMTREERRQSDRIRTRAEHKETLAKVAYQRDPAPNAREIYNQVQAVRRINAEHILRALQPAEEEAK